MLDQVLFRKADKLDILLRNVDSSDNHEAAISKLVNFLNSIRLIDLIHLLAKNNHLVQVLMQERYNDYWDNELSRLPVRGIVEPFSYKKPRNISSLEFLMGYVLSNELAVKGAQPGPLDDFFELAVTYHSFHALNQGIQALVSWLYDQTKRMSADNLEPYMNLIQNEMKYHGTPGYLLAVKFYFYLMCMEVERAAATLDIMEQQECLRYKDYYLINAYSCVLLARSAEPESAVEMHNACLGGTLVDVYPFGANTIEEIEQWFKEYDPNTLSPHIREQLNQQALDIQKRDQLVLNDRRTQHYNTRLYTENIQDAARDGQPYFEEPVLIAARMGKLNDIQSLVEEFGHGVLNATDHRGNTALHIAVFLQNHTLERYLKKVKPELSGIKNKNGDKAADLVDKATLKIPTTSNISAAQNSFFKRESPSSSSSKVHDTDTTNLPTKRR